MHKLLGPEVGDQLTPEDAGKLATELVGGVIFRSNKTFPMMPAEFTVPSGVENGVLCLEVGYSFLGSAWGKGFATEALAAVLEGLKSSKDFLSPFTKLYVEGIVSHENPRSIRVLERLE